MSTEPIYAGLTPVTFQKRYSVNGVDTGLQVAMDEDQKYIDKKLMTWAEANGVDLRLPHQLGIHIVKV